MPDQDFRNDHSEEINRKEHRRKNVGAKAVVLHGYNAGTDEYIPVDVDASGNLATAAGSSNYALLLDDTTTANVTYVGLAAIGSSAANAVWQIKKIDETSGLVITWADGNDSFDNVWDNRATSISYS